MLLHDLRCALRSLARRPGWTAVTVLILGFSIGAGTTVFTWMEGALLHPLPGVTDDARIVKVAPARSQGAMDHYSVAYPEFLEVASRSASFSGVLAHELRPVVLTFPGGAERVWATLTSRNYFDVLGVRAALGRTYMAREEGMAPAPPEVVMSHSLWARAFGGDTQVIGQSVTVNGKALTVVGVAPPGFVGAWPGLSFDLFVPVNIADIVALGGASGPSRGNRWLEMTARLAPGVPREAAEAELQAIMRRMGEEDSGSMRNFDPALFPLWRAPGGSAEIMGPALYALAGMVLVLLLVACSNVATLLLARGLDRRREIAARVSVGAGQSHIVRMLLAEAMVLALLAGAAGALMAFWSVGLLSSFIPPMGLPIAAHAALSVRGLAIALGLSLFTCLVSGLLPSLQASRLDAAQVLREEGRGVSEGAWGGRLRNGLVVAQIALSLLLLASAGLFARSLARIRALDPGFDPRGVTLASLDLLSAGLRGDEATVFCDLLRERLAATSGVEAVTLAAFAPLRLGGFANPVITVDGHTPPPGSRFHSSMDWVDADYFRTLGIPLVAGRAFTPSDKRDSEPVAIVNETLVRRFWPDREPVGSRIGVNGVWRTIVGVARDSKYASLRDQGVRYLYVPLAQGYMSPITAHLRTTLDTASVADLVRREAGALNRDVAVYDVRPLAENLKGQFFTQRLGTSLLAVFGLVTLLLAGFGLYWVVSYRVSRRVREFGLRLALGARPADILRLALGQTALVVAIGSTIGLAAAVAVGRLLSTVIFGIDGLDLASLAGATAVLGAVAAAASFLPAWRAARTDPAAALRTE